MKNKGYTTFISQDDLALIDNSKNFPRKKRHKRNLIDRKLSPVLESDQSLLPGVVKKREHDRENS